MTPMPEPSTPARHAWEFQEWGPQSGSYLCAYCFRRRRFLWWIFDRRCDA